MLMLADACRMTGAAGLGTRVKLGAGQLAPRKPRWAAAAGAGVSNGGATYGSDYVKGASHRARSTDEYMCKAVTMHIHARTQLAWPAVFELLLVALPHCC